MLRAGADGWTEGEKTGEEGLLSSLASVRRVGLTDRGHEHERPRERAAPADRVGHLLACSSPIFGVQKF